MKAILGACRGCMAEVSAPERRSDQRLADKFAYCTNLEMVEHDGLPKHFCGMCEDTIISCYRFIREARKVDLAMRSMLSPIKTDVDVLSDKTDLPKLEDEIKQEDEIKDEYRSCKGVEIKEDCTDSNVPKANVQIVVELAVPDTAFSEDDVDNEDISYPKDEHIENNGEKLMSEYEKNVKNILAKAPKRKRKNSDNSPHECEYCHKSFSTKLWYKKHLTSVHSDNTNSNFVCKLCSKGFSRSDILKQHMVTHSAERPFACHLCPKRFKMRKQLNLHLRMHEEQAEYMCHVCNATFQWKAVLQTHMKIHFAKKSNLCHLCGTGFTLAGNLAVHMRTHTGEKPYSCARCSFRCSMQSSLRRHERTHTGVRPHVCATCDKRFADASSLSRHIRTHTGELPYRCKFCSRAFIDSGKRKRHMLSQHQLATTDLPISSLHTQASGRPTSPSPPPHVKTLLKSIQKRALLK